MNAVRCRDRQGVPSGAQFNYEGLYRKVLTSLLVDIHSKESLRVAVSGMVPRRQHPIREVSRTRFLVSV